MSQVSGAVAFVPEQVDPADGGIQLMLQLRIKPAEPAPHGGTGWRIQRRIQLHERSFDFFDLVKVNVR